MNEKFFGYDRSTAPVSRSLRECVSEIMHEVAGDENKYPEAGKWIRESVGLFFDEHEGGFPNSFVFSPELMLFVADASLAKYHIGQIYEPDRNSPTGFKYTSIKSVAKIKDQTTMYPTWVTHSGLILNAIDRNFRRNKLLIRQ